MTCGGSQANITAFKSLEVDNCDISTSVEVEHTQRIKLLQKAELFPYVFNLHRLLHHQMFRI